jgi:hypothetical protein
MNDLAKCRKCGAPIFGSDWFCSNCGERAGNAPQAVPSGAPGRSPGGKVIVWVLAVVAVVGVAGAAGVYVVGRRVIRAVGTRFAGSAAGDGAVGRVARSLGKMAREEKRPDSYGCSLLSREDAATIAGTAVTRTESTSDTCVYYGIPDPSLNPEAVSIKSIPGISTDPQASKMIDQFTGAMRASEETKDPGLRAGPGGERLLFAVHSSAALSASMEAARSVSGTSLGGEVVPGIGEEAIFTTAHRMFFVRKGTSYILIQSQFVKDPRGVAVAAAKKVLESPNLGG